MATCKTCEKTIRKNCFGMNKHLMVLHQIIVEDKYAIEAIGKPNINYALDR